MKHILGIVLVILPVLIRAGNIITDERGNTVIEVIDSLLYLRIFEATQDTTFQRWPSNEEEFPDIYFEYRIANLNQNTPLELEFNKEVKRYLYIYLFERKEQVSKILTLGEYYFPIFEEYLDKYKLPFELKYLPVVESALNPLARSSSGAVGLWQFKLSSGKMLDLEVNSYIDERSDPVKSTEAACRYLEYLYNIFKDWNLVLAAYNSGPGAVRNAIARSNGDLNYWKIKEALPEQARNYIPAFIAANYVMNYYMEHNIVPSEPVISFFETDTVELKHSTSLNKISEELNISIHLLRFLNPAYKLGYIPKNGDRIGIVLPSNKIVAFIQSENKIYADFLSSKNSEFKIETEKIQNQVKIIHDVKKGEFLHMLALKYHCSIENIVNWNNLQDKSLREGQVLDIWINENDYYKYFSK
ncbi:transglycosylase SLT domain-containing protein [Bacteroidota bacterium]